MITHLICRSMYHIFKAKLSPGVVMVAKGDVGNKYNQLALTVKLPNGKIFGRVPANMCKIFSTLLNKRNILTISCVAVAYPKQMCWTTTVFQKTYKIRDAQRRWRGSDSMQIYLKCCDSCYSCLILFTHFCFWNKLISNYPLCYHLI